MEEVHEEFGRKINQDVNGNRKLFWKESKANGEKVESCSRIKDGNGRLIQEEVQRFGSTIFRIFII